MSGSGDHEGMDGELAAWVREVVDHVAATAAAMPVLPDFAESVARARAIDETMVSESMIDEARALAPIIPIHYRELDDAPRDPEFAGFLADVLAERVAFADRRKLAAIPAAPLPRRRHLRAVLWAIGASVAALALGWGLSRGGGVAIDEGADEGMLQAPFSHEIEGGGEAVSRVPSGAKRAHADAGTADADLVPSLELTDDATTEPLAPGAPALAERELEAPPRARRDPTPPVSSLEGELARLDAIAQAHLAAGERDAAEAAYREIIHKGKRGRMVQLAYGDLFTVVRATRGPAGEAELWQEYVRRFPHGPHADDARSGLCRRVSDATARARCWSDYLDDFPEGSHRAHAQREAEPP